MLLLIISLIIVSLSKKIKMLKSNEKALSFTYWQDRINKHKCREELKLKAKKYMEILFRKGEFNIKVKEDEINKELEEKLKPKGRVVLPNIKKDEQEKLRQEAQKSINEAIKEGERELIRNAEILFNQFIEEGTWQKLSEETVKPIKELRQEDEGELKRKAKILFNQFRAEGEKQSVENTFENIESLRNKSLKKQEKEGITKKIKNDLGIIRTKSETKLPRLLLPKKKYQNIYP